MLVDTDSAITIIRADIWEKVSVYCKHSGSNYTSSGGSKWKGYGQVVLNIHGGGGGGGGLHVDQLFLVVMDLTQECLLGTEFLCANGCAINFDTRSMSEVVILQLGPLVCDAVVMESISIPANCEFQLVATLMVDGKMCRNSNVGVLEPQPNFMERHGTFGGNQQRWCNPRANVESR